MLGVEISTAGSTTEAAFEVFDSLYRCLVIGLSEKADSDNISRKWDIEQVYVMGDEVSTSLTGALDVG